MGHSLLSYCCDSKYDALQVSIMFSSKIDGKRKLNANLFERIGETRKPIQWYYSQRSLVVIIFRSGSRYERNF